HGAHLLQSCAVRSIETQAGRVCGVVTEQGPIQCDQVVLAGGSWSRLFAGNLGISIPQLKVLATAARVDTLDGRIPALPVAADNFAFRRRADGGYTIARSNANIAQITTDNFRLFKEFAPALAKGWRELRVRAGKQLFKDLRVPKRWSNQDTTPFEQTRILDPDPAPGLNHEAVRNLSHAFPGFAQCRISHEWAGMIDVTPDAVPIIGQAGQIDGLFIATGFSGHGFGLGPAAGELIADLVRGVAPRVDPSPFRFGRFTKK
ncbi:MAG TPA: FAD-binding oxidoreductase, partial [Burkholderiaceae bacterium]|nr:FAD-binding oxidoreductase [Burkholderiaceae bacterium]